MNLDHLAAELHRVITAAGVAIVGVSIGKLTDKTTWKVQPALFQPAAQPIIDAFDVDDPMHDSAQLNLEVLACLEKERIFSAIVWAMLDTYSNPATIAKYGAARAKIIAAFKTQPWKA